MTENVLSNEGERQHCSRGAGGIFTTVQYSGRNGSRQILVLYANRRTPLQRLPNPVRVELTQFLELAAEVSWKHGWEGVVVQLNSLMLSEGRNENVFDTVTILHIKSRGQNSVMCPTELLLMECEAKGSIFIEHLIKAIEATENQPALTAICQGYLSMSEAHDHRMEQLASDGSNFRDRAVNPPQGHVPQGHVSQGHVPQGHVSQGHVPQGHRTKDSVIRRFFRSTRGAIERTVSRNSSGTDSSSSDTAAPGHLEVRSVHSNGGSAESLQSSCGAEDDGQSDRGSAKSVTMSIQRLPSARAGERGVRVFLTYSCSNRHRMITVCNMAKCLVKNNFSVQHEASNQLQLAQDKLGWLDTTFRNADFILVLITPEYADDVMNVASENLVIDPSDRALNSRYIYKLMQSEYFNNKCINRRFIPVLMPAVRDLPATSRDLVPNWLTLTLIYRWPVHYLDLFSRMIRPDKIMRDLIVGRGQANANQDIYVSRS